MSGAPRGKIENMLGNGRTPILKQAELWVVLVGGALLFLAGQRHEGVGGWAAAGWAVGAVSVGAVLFSALDWLARKGSLH